MSEPTHDCACDFGYAGGHEPTCPKSHLYKKPETGGTPRSLIAQWRDRAHVSSIRQRSDVMRQCADELEAALKPLADLEAEMRRFAEAESAPVNTGRRTAAERFYSPAGLQALAWAETLKGLHQRSSQPYSPSDGARRHP